MDFFLSYDPPDSIVMFSDETKKKMFENTVVVFHLSLLDSMFLSNIEMCSYISILFVFYL